METKETLTAEEVEAIGKEVGLDAVFIRQAMSEFAKEQQALKMCGHVAKPTVWKVLSKGWWLQAGGLLDGQFPSFSSRSFKETSPRRFSLPVGEYTLASGCCYRHGQRPLRARTAFHRFQTSCQGLSCLKCFSPFKGCLRGKNKGASF